MKTLKVAGVLGLVFLAGLAGGVVATRVVVRRMVATAVAHPEVVRFKAEHDLDVKLRLDPQQRQQIHEILKESHDRTRAVREDFQPKFNAAVIQTRTNISAVLKPAQQELFEQFLEDNRQFLGIRELPPPRKN